MTKKMSEKIKVAMVTAVAMACDYVDKYPNSEMEKVLQFIMKEMPVEGDEKVGAIVGASKAYKEKINSGKANKAIVQDIMDQADNILMTIGGN